MYMHIEDIARAEPQVTQTVSLPAAGDLASKTINAVFSLLDEAGISYCIPHGWEGLPETRGSDIDVIVGRTATPAELVRLLSANPQRLGAALVRARGGFITLCRREPHGLPIYLNFDFAADHASGPVLIASGEMLLAGRRRRKGFWIPAAGAGFAAELARALLRRKLDRSSAARLSRLFSEDASGSRAMLAAFWPESRARALAAAAESGDWRPVLDRAPRLRAELRRRLSLRAPGHALRCIADGVAARAAKLFDPPGLNVVLLGPDGAGKSSTIAALETVLAPLFARSEVRGFAPTLRQLLRRPPRSTSTPHALKPRSLSASILRAGWWSAYGLWSHVGLQVAKARSTLILNDRHFIDILVDPVRYRYGGPRWLLSVLCRLMPRPDLVILLDGPADVLQARKKELTVAETERQLRDYRALVAGLPGSHVVDAAQPFAAVVSDIAGLAAARLSPQGRSAA